MVLERSEQTMVIRKTLQSARLEETTMLLRNRGQSSAQFHQDNYTDIRKIAGNDTVHNRGKVLKAWGLHIHRQMDLKSKEVLV